MPKSSKGKAGKHRPDFFYCSKCGKEIHRRDKRATREHEALAKTRMHSYGMKRKNVVVS